MTGSPRTPSPEDPLLRRARTEMFVAAGIWLAALVYSVGYSVLFGYGRSLDSLTFVLGFPDWIFWGVIVPWSLCTLASVWFGLVFMRDDALEEGLHVDDLREEESG